MMKKFAYTVAIAASFAMPATAQDVDAEKVEPTAEEQAAIMADKQASAVDVSASPASVASGVDVAKPEADEMPEDQESE